MYVVAPETLGTINRGPSERPSFAVMMAIAVFNPGSSQAAIITDLFNLLLVICAAILLIVSFLVFYSIIRFRARPGAPEPPQITGSKKIEVLWTALPLLLLFFIFFLTAHAMSPLTPLSHQQPDLTVTGHQWWWEARYKSGAITANELHIPVGEKLLVRLEAADVIHDFWVPRLARKMDLVPGHTNYIWLQADQPGTYQGACAEYCGAQHAWMRFVVIAEPRETFARWEQQQAQPPASIGNASEGSKLLRDKTCLNCHALGSSSSANAGPDLAHIASRQFLASGLLANTPENMRRWLADPQAVKPGVLMPRVHMTDAELNALVACLEALK